MITKSTDPKIGACLATFTCLPPHGAKHVSICGDFNQWQAGHDTMTREADGTFTITLTLKEGSRFSFKYLADVGGWLNDEKADDYLQNEYGVWNSIVATPAAPKKPAAKKAPAKKAVVKSEPEKPAPVAKKAPAKKAPAKKKAAAKKAKP
ncbi:MAG: isoamylase early set domain-containing protein [Verrucomicrobiales bacterium]